MYLDLAWELKKAMEHRSNGDIDCNWRTRNRPQKNLLRKLEELKIEGRIETIQTTALLWSAIILRRVLGTWVNLLSFKLQWNPGVKNSQGVK